MELLVYVEELCHQRPSAAQYLIRSTSSSRGQIFPVSSRNFQFRQEHTTDRGNEIEQRNFQRVLPQGKGGIIQMF
jgi:hypothetical protein